MPIGIGRIPTLEETQEQAKEIKEKTGSLWDDLKKRVVGLTIPRKEGVGFKEAGEKYLADQKSKLDANQKYIQDAIDKGEQSSQSAEDSKPTVEPLTGEDKEDKNKKGKKEKKVNLEQLKNAKTKFWGMFEDLKRIQFVDPKSLAELKGQIGKASEKYEKEKAGVEAGDFWSTIAAGVAQIAAGIYAANKGILIGEIKMPPSQRKDKIDSLREDFKIKIAELLGDYERGIAERKEEFREKEMGVKEAGARLAAEEQDVTKQQEIIEREKDRELRRELETGKAQAKTSKDLLSQYVKKQKDINKEIAGMQDELSEKASKIEKGDSREYKTFPTIMAQLARRAGRLKGISDASMTRELNYITETLGREWFGLSGKDLADLDEKDALKVYKMVSRLMNDIRDAEYVETQDEKGNKIGGIKFMSPARLDSFKDIRG